MSTVKNQPVTASLLAWVCSQLQESEAARWCCPNPLSLSVLGGDAGFRCYYRVSCQPSLLAVFAPIATEDSRAFVAIARYLRAQGVATPEIIAADFDRGFLLIEDFGDELLSTVLGPATVNDSYRDAMSVLLRIQGASKTEIPAAEGDRLHGIPGYDRERLMTEMKLFQQWFIPELLGYDLNDDETAVLDEAYSLLADSALSQPCAWVHRDFHSRNLIYRQGQLPGVIDFQDAVFGPVTYDLVSLLRDCYVRWPAHQVRGWALQYRDMAVESGQLAMVSDEEFLRWFDWMGLQRHLKVLGIFARLWLRDGKAGYLSDLPLVIRYTLEVADQYSELQPFVDLFRAKLLPLCEKQAWYQNYLTVGGEA